MSFSLNNYLFGPLNAEFCNYFYALSVINYIMFIFIIISLIMTLLFRRKSVDKENMMALGFGALLYGILYFQNRLLHSMCVKTEGLDVKPHEPTKKKFE